MSLSHLRSIIGYFFFLLQIESVFPTIPLSGQVPNSVRDETSQLQRETQLITFLFFLLLHFSSLSSLSLLL